MGEEYTGHLKSRAHKFHKSMQSQGQQAFQPVDYARGCGMTAYVRHLVSEAWRAVRRFKHLAKTTILSACQRSICGR
jgi:hypothetical protein